MGSIGSREDSMNIPFDEWGKEISSQAIYDENGDLIGFIDDRTIYESEHRLTPITKKEAVDYALSFWGGKEDGWIVDDDYKIYFAYSDGTFRDVADNPEKGLNRQGLVGVYVSTPDDEISWGGNITWRNGEPRLQQWSVHDENGNEVEGDYHSWYEDVAMYRRRERETFGRNGRKFEIIRKSTVKRLK